MNVKIARKTPPPMMPTATSATRSPLGVASLVIAPATASAQSRLDGLRLPAPGVSATALLALAARLKALRGLGFARWPALQAVHPVTRRLLAGWGYAYDAWSLRRFEPAKRHAVLICTLEAALAEG